MRVPCPICGGSHRIRLPVRGAPTYSVTVTEDYAPARYLEYPCPECSKVTDASFKIATIDVAMSHWEDAEFDSSEHRQFYIDAIKEQCVSDLTRFMLENHLIDFKIKRARAVGAVMTATMGAMNPHRLDDEISERDKASRNAVSNFVKRLKSAVNTAGYGIPTKPYKTLTKQQIIELIDSEHPSGQ